VSQATGEPGKPVHDEFSHGADALRYLAVCSDEMSNDDSDWKPLKINTKGIV
jgi:phage terminase large subunit